VNICKFLCLRSMLFGLCLFAAPMVCAEALSPASPPMDFTAAPPLPDMAGRLTLINENDYYASDDDRHYTQGARLSYLSGQVTPDGLWDQPFAVLSHVPMLFAGEKRKRKYAVLAGQNLFTPSNTQRTSALDNDRPYAGWLYAGASLLQESQYASHHTLENFEVLGGVVGRWALGGITQNDFHQFVGVDPALGWQNQLKNEPGLIVSYARKWRFQQPLYHNLAVDIIPELGASGGNILTYGQASIMVRFGQNLGADYGPSRIRPSLSGTDWFDPAQLDGAFGWYVFVGTQGRAVARNIFLDGNTFDSSPHVNKKPLVADFIGGASLFWSNTIRLDFSVVQRTQEFYNQTGHPDRFGGINLTFSFL
jgi:lipid A 3-O-deacylase